ncbi:hypothetical protein HXA34_10055 [Salipaludibacillus agaradhaerens]|uniref:TcaA NTF2-like domain-containing protein n=1 Tax=Salipaludibacillus agaradhaerens TaxID=76935 RepID=UPI0021512958|nr:hypothetical protein [Salipaludibacillus agaradhaerens]MCR6106626.1 hypothetical protein [Salipaludibacillus agaradhaerens]MCR6118659.1 hypothetical protein [Salipaludibacillus agaradhaerens]
MKKFIVGWLVILMFLTACDEEEIWADLENKADKESLITFMYDYKEAWEESLESQSFSLMEPFFVGNSHVYHMERRQHQQLIGERKIERFDEALNIHVEQNQFEEYRVRWEEEVTVEQFESSFTELRQRQFYISEGSNGYRITAIERIEENKED